MPQELGMIFIKTYGVIVLIVLVLFVIFGRLSVYTKRYRDKKEAQQYQALLRGIQDERFWAQVEGDRPEITWEEKDRYYGAPW